MAAATEALRAAAASAVLAAFLLLLLSVQQVPGQGTSRRIVGDIREQKISDVADPDERDNKLYRRPPTYLIIASKIVRPSTVYQVSPVVEFSRIEFDYFFPHRNPRIILSVKPRRSLEVCASTRLDRSEAKVCPPSGSVAFM